MASISKRTRTAKVKDKRTGEIREKDVEFWRARYRDEGGKEHARHRTVPMLEAVIAGHGRPAAVCRDQRHYFASLPIASGADVKAVQA